MDRSGRADETSDRMHRGRELGGGVCLGVDFAGDDCMNNGEEVGIALSNGCCGGWGVFLTALAGVED